MKTWKLSTIFLFLPFILLTAAPIKPPKPIKSPRPIKSPSAARPVQPKPPTIKTLLFKESEGFLLEACGAFAVFNPENGKKLSSGRLGKRFYLHPHEEGIRWGEDFPGIFQLQIVPTDSKTTFLIDGIQYSGALEIYHTGETVNVINEVDVEIFLKATLMEKVSPDISPSVLDALAIIARTDAYYTALLNHNSFYHIDAKEFDYRGVGLTRQNFAVERAIERTHHLVMTYRHQPFPTTWTEHCAGKTANYSKIFRKQTPAPQGIESHFALENRERSHWSFICEAQELAQIVKLNRVTSIDLFVDSDSGKVYGLRVRDGNYSQELDFFTLQRTLGKERLKSSEFTVSIQGNLLAFEGYGEGTGVGLCLYSAAKHSQRGDQAPDILATFFPHTDLEKIDTYPKLIISADQATFVSPKQKKRKYKILQQ